MNSQDRMFTDMKFGDKWASELHLVVVSNGSRYNSSLFGEFQDAVQYSPGRSDGVYFSTNHTGRPFSVSFAFDEVSGEDLNAIEEWLYPEKIAKLIFSETPYQFAIGKVASRPSFNYLPFEKKIKIDGKIFNQSVFKGELEVNFIIFDKNVFSTYGYYEDVLADMGEKNPAEYPAWIMNSNLLSKSGETALKNKNIYCSDFYVESLATTDTLYIVNSGTDKARLHISFKLTADLTESGLSFDIFKRTYGNPLAPDEFFSSFQLKKFSDYLPFQKIWKEDPDWNKWIIDIDPYNMEVFIFHTEDRTKRVNLGVQMSSNDFLYLAPVKKINYLKSFTNLDKPNDCALESAVLNKFIPSQNIREVNFHYKHTYL